jgi:hypothetical protein
LAEWDDEIERSLKLDPGDQPFEAFGIGQVKVALVEDRAQFFFEPGRDQHALAGNEAPPFGLESLFSGYGDGFVVPAADTNRFRRTLETPEQPAEPEVHQGLHQVGFVVGPVRIAQPVVQRFHRRIVGFGVPGRKEVGEVARFAVRQPARSGLSWDGLLLRAGSADSTC